MTFQEFLEKKAQPAHYQERRERREEWITAVRRLLDQLRAWLAESDPMGVLDAVPMEIEKSEPGLGTYRVSSLKISLGEAAVDVGFFTMAWWCGAQVGPVGDPGADYVVHLATIRDRLPPDLRAIEKPVSLHDTRLRELRLIVADRTLALVLDTYAGDERLTLEYSGVERFESLADPEVGLCGPAGYGDLGYWEVDVLPHQAFEHRLLFSSGIELVVVLRGFRLQRFKSAEPGTEASQPRD